MRENKKHTTRVSSVEAARLIDETDDERLDAMTDRDIAKAVADDPDAPPLDLDWTQARLVLPPGKDIITLRLDRDVLNWFRAQGKGYQTRINQVLRHWYETERLQRQWEREKREKTAIEKAAKDEDPMAELARLLARLDTPPSKPASKRKVEPSVKDEHETSWKKVYAAANRAAAKKAEAAKPPAPAKKRA
jgi:uncharacterized protein (DUF4415 family)